MASTSPAWFLAAVVSMAAQQAGQPAAVATAPASSAIIGQVVDAATGVPIAGANVTLITPEATADPRASDSFVVRELTSDQGEFAFGPLAAGSYRLGVAMGGYLSAANGRQRPGGADQPLIVADRETLDHVTVKMWKGGVVSGTVTDEAGEPVVGNRVNVMRRSWTTGRAVWTVEGTPSTDDRGVYRMANLDPGEYTAMVPGMRVSYPVGFAPTAQFNAPLLEIARYETQILPINAAGNAQFPQNMTTYGAAGSNINELAGGFLTQTPEEARSTAPAITAHGPMQVYPTTFAPGSTTPTHARAVTLAAGEAVSDLDIQLPLTPAVNVTGTVSTAAGPCPLVLVRLQPVDDTGAPADSGFAAAIGVADKSGAFALRGVPAGQYVLRASQGISAITTGPEPMAIAQPLSVGAEDIANLAVQLQPAVEISGEVRFEGDQSKVPASMALMLRQDGGARVPPQSRVDPDGTFSIAVEPGSYVISFAGQNPFRGWYMKSAMLRGRDISAVATDFASDASGVVVTFTDNPNGISGTVRASDGAADPTATILVFPVDKSLWTTAGEHSRLFASVRPGRDGRYILKGLPPGGYYAIAVTDADLAEPRDPRFLESAARVADQVAVRDGEILPHDLKTAVVR